MKTFLTEESGAQGEGLKEVLSFIRLELADYAALTINDLYSQLSMCISILQFVQGRVTEETVTVAGTN